MGKVWKSLVWWMVGFEPTTQKNMVLPTTPFGVLVRLTTCKMLTNSLPKLSLIAQRQNRQIWGKCAIHHRATEHLSSSIVPYEICFAHWMLSLTPGGHKKARWCNVGWPVVVALLSKPRFFVWLSYPHLASAISWGQVVYHNKAVCDGVRMRTSRQQVCTANTPLCSCPSVWFFKNIVHHQYAA